MRIVWHYLASDERRTYTISYRVRDAAVAYNDVIDVGWTVWGDQWDFDLDSLSAELTDAALDPASDAYRVWGHPREVEGETVRGAGEATLEASDVPGGTAVEFRVVLPREPGRDVSGMRQVPRDGLAEILAAEASLDEDFNTPWKRLVRFVRDHAVAIAAAIAALLAALVALFALLARERPASVPEYLAEPPDDASPALAYGLAREGADSNDTVLATLLDLIDRGLYETSQRTTKKEKLDLAIAARPDQQAELEPHEQAVREFFDELLDGETIALSGLSDQIPEHSATWRARWERMTEKLNEAEAGAISWDRDLRPARALLALLATAAFGGVFAAALDGGAWLGALAIEIPALIALIAFPGARLRRVSPEHTERSQRWRAFERWTEDFPRLEDDPPATLELWKRILVYGVAFGTAKRMLESGRIPAPVLADSASGSHWSTYALSGSLDGSLSGTSFSSGFASQVAPESSSSGGGGGFSGGGGGGFSGGGGGGSW